MGTRGHRDAGTRKQGDMGTRGQGDMGTWGQGDTGSGDKKGQERLMGENVGLGAPAGSWGGGAHGQLPQLGDTGGGGQQGGPHRAALLALAADDAQLDLQRRHLLPLHLPLQLGNPRALAALLVAGAWGGTGPPCPQGAQGDGRTSPRGCGEQRGQRCSHKGKGSLGGGNVVPNQEWDPKVWE